MAIKAAETAFPMWRRTPAPKRGEILYAFGALMAEHKERLARAMTREMGKVLAEARGDVQEGIDIAYLMAGEGRRMFGDTVPSELPDKWAMSIRQPIGVAGIITPWNFPMAIPCWKTMPALVTGNTVVFKPSSDTPHCATLLVELMAEAGFPPGVVNLVTGSGDEVGDAIVDSPDVAVISFTGTSATGKRHRGAGRPPAQAPVARARWQERRRRAGRRRPRPRRPTASCGRPSARPVSAARPASRVIVERSVVEPLLERLEARAADPAARLGPRSGDRRRSAHQRRRRRQGRLVRRDRARRGRARRWAAGGRRRRPGQRPFLRADHLRRRRADGPHRPGGDLRPGPVGHPRRRLRRRDAGRSTRPATACRRASSPAT